MRFGALHGEPGSSRSGASGWNPRRTGIRSRTTASRVSRNVGKPDVEHRELGASGLSVSVLALGSWRTWQWIAREDAIATLNAAREAGIDCSRPPATTTPTGYSEVVFGEIFRASGWPRDEVTIANKLWWEFWPEQSVAEEIDASLQRTGLDHFDFIYSDPPPTELGDGRGRQRGRRSCCGRARRGRGAS